LLILPDALKASLHAEAARAHPAECCGLLEGFVVGEAIHITAIHPSPNLSPEPERAFLIDPGLHLALQRSLRETGRRVVGCYHSHPTGNPGPSARDRANGCDGDLIWVIIVTGVMAAYKAPDFAVVAIT
jgi:Predicted metal-dependent protease of the PAD1/JAB1 superfamily